MNLSSSSAYLRCGWVLVGKRIRPFGRDVKLKSPIMSVSVGCGELLSVGGRYVASSWSCCRRVVVWEGSRYKLMI